MGGKELSRLFDKREKLEVEKQELIIELNNVEEDLIQARLDIKNAMNKEIV